MSAGRTKLRYRQWLKKKWRECSGATARTFRSAVRPRVISYPQILSALYNQELRAPAACRISNVEGGLRRQSETALKNMNFPPRSRNRARSSLELRARFSWSLIPTIM
jgi:hypothetical protein